MKMSDVTLPSGWALANVGDLADYINGRAFKPSEWKDSGKPIIRIQNLNKNDAKYNFSPLNHEEKYLVKNGDLLFAWSASLGVYLWNGSDAWLNQHIFKVLPKACTTRNFIFYLLEKITAELYAKAHGSGMVHVTKGKFESTEISLPPLNEQRRIVTKIEELFSELDKGIENLKTARAQLKVYRQALLKHAFEGKLTAQWRAENQDKLETAEALLKHIQHERAQRYQQQIVEWEASGKKGSKPKAPKALPPLTSVELAELPELPKGWGWVRLDEISEKITDGDHQAPPQTTEGIPFITISDIKNQRIDFSDTRYVSQSYFDGLSDMRKPMKDDILYTVTGSFGIPCLIDFNHEFCFQRHIGLIRSCKEISKKFLYYLLSSRNVYGQAASVATGTAQKTVPLGGLRLFKIPLMSHEEQQQIANELESRLSETDQLDQTITTSLQQAEALRQSILKKAFSGQLVPQDPDDEPASVLLARIKAKNQKKNGLGDVKSPKVKEVS
jgi:type I restriction enzyme S subunit